eukprot:jgi/Chrzof1/13877/Cz08g15270.t1
MCSTMPNGDYDYPCVLGAAMLFYEAQRSGSLPANNRIKWRGNSGLYDVAPNNQSLAGGWYDAGDLTKFTFPAAWAIQTLALGYLEFTDGYQKAGQVETLMANLKWGADWLMAARYSADGFVAVTWMPGRDVRASHRFWGHPEDLAQPAGVAAVTAGIPASDLLSAGAAALAATSVVFKAADPAYSQQCLQVAQDLYNQAIDSEGLYSKSVPAVQGYYDSYSTLDDLTLAAAWLALRTGDRSILQQAQEYYQRHIDEEGGGEMRRYDYNNVVQAAGYLLAKLDPANKDKYSQPIRTVMDKWLNAQANITYSPKGLAYIDSWGNLRYVSNQALMGLLHNKLYPDNSKRSTVYACFARKQMRYILGADTQQSYVVGVGIHPGPCQAHHRAASCGMLGTPCDCSAYLNTGCNPNIIYGALVGGPDVNDEFVDQRSNYQQAEVAVDWNAGFTGVMAALSTNPISWSQCQQAGQENGRGRVSPNINAAQTAAASSPLLMLFMSLAGVVIMQAALHAH